MNIVYRIILLVGEFAFLIAFVCILTIMSIMADPLMVNWWALLPLWVAIVSLGLRYVTIADR